VNEIDTVERGKAGLVEPIVTFLVATGLAAGLFWLARSVSFVREILHGGIALVFLLAPSYAARIWRRPFDYRAAGLGITPVKSNLRILALALATTWPLFLAGFLLYYGLLCTGSAPAWARPLTGVLAPICPGWLGLRGFTLQLPAGLALLALSQLLVVALPEEVFFRGYLMSRLEERWPSRHRLWGAAVGWPLLISSLLWPGPFPCGFPTCAPGCDGAGAGLRVDATALGLAGPGGCLPRPVQPVLRRSVRKFLRIAVQFDPTN